MSDHLVLLACARSSSTSPACWCSLPYLNHDPALQAIPRSLPSSTSSATPAACLPWRALASFPSRTSAPPCFQCSLPDPNQRSRSTARSFSEIERTPEAMSVRVSEDMSERMPEACQEICLKMPERYVTKKGRKNVRRYVRKIVRFNVRRYARKNFR